MLKTINGNLCFKSFITFARALLPDPNNKNSLVFMREPLFRELHKHLLVFWGKHWPHFCISGETEARAGQLFLAQGGRQPSLGVSGPRGGLWLPVDVCLSMWFTHAAEWKRASQSPQRQNPFKHKVTVKQLSRKTDLGCLVLPAQLSHSGAPSSAAAGSFWLGHAVALWRRGS